MRTTRERCEYWRGVYPGLLVAAISLRMGTQLPKDASMGWTISIGLLVMAIAALGYSMSLNKAAIAEKYAKAAE